MSSFAGGGDLDGVTHGDSRLRAVSSSSDTSSGSLESSGKSIECPRDIEMDKKEQKSQSLRGYGQPLAT